MKLRNSILILAATLSLAACGDKKTSESTDGTATDSVEFKEIDKTAAANDTVAPAVDTEAPVTVTVRGKVSQVTNGKDGYTAQIKDDSGREYFVTISRVNMADGNQYKEVKAGDMITVKGESFKMGDELHIKAETLE